MNKNNKTTPQISHNYDGLLQAVDHLRAGLQELGLALERLDRSDGDVPWQHVEKAAIWLHAYDRVLREFCKQHGLDLARMQSLVGAPTENRLARFAIWVKDKKSRGSVERCAASLADEVSNLFQRPPVRGTSSTGRNGRNPFAPRAESRRRYRRASYFSSAASALDTSATRASASSASDMSRHRYESGR